MYFKIPSTRKRTFSSKAFYSFLVKLLNIPLSLFGKLCIAITNKCNLVMFGKKLPQKKFLTKPKITRGCMRDDNSEKSELFPLLMSGAREFI